MGPRDKGAITPEMRIRALVNGFRQDAIHRLSRAQRKERELGYLTPKSDRLPEEINPFYPLLDFDDVPGWVADDRALRAQAAAFDQCAELLATLLPDPDSADSHSP